MELATLGYKWVLDLRDLLKRLIECTIPPNHSLEEWKYRAFICQLTFPLVKICHMGHKFSHISMCVQASQAANVKEGSYGLRQGHSACTYTKQVNMCADLFSATMIRKKMRPSASTVVKEMSNTCVYYLCYLHNKQVIQVH